MDRLESMIATGDLESFRVKLVQIHEPPNETAIIIGQRAI